MTTHEKLSALKDKTGRNWGNIAEILGVSRQMLDFVRRGERNFSARVDEKLDALLSDIQTIPDGLPPKLAAAPPVPRPPSAGDAALLRRLYDLADAAEAPHKAANAAKDTAAMAVPGLLLNFAALVRVIDADTAPLGLLGSLLYMVRIGITSDRKHLDFAKTLLDRLAGDQP